MDLFVYTRVGSKDLLVDWFPLSGSADSTAFPPDHQARVYEAFGPNIIVVLRHRTDVFGEVDVVVVGSPN
jgi:hypothetical protein